MPDTRLKIDSKTGEHYRFVGALMVHVVLLDRHGTGGDGDPRQMPFCGVEGKAGGLGSLELELILEDKVREFVRQTRDRAVLVLRFLRAPKHSTVNLPGPLGRLPLRTLLGIKLVFVKHLSGDSQKGLFSGVQRRGTQQNGRDGEEL